MRGATPIWPSLGRHLSANSLFTQHCPASNEICAVLYWRTSCTATGLFLLALAELVPKHADSLRTICTVRASEYFPQFNNMTLMSPLGMYNIVLIRKIFVLLLYRCFMLKRNIKTPSFHEPSQSVLGDIGQNYLSRNTDDVVSFSRLLMMLCPARRSLRRNARTTLLGSLASKQFFNNPPNGSEYAI